MSENRENNHNPIEFSVESEVVQEPVPIQQTVGQPMSAPPHHTAPPQYMEQIPRPPQSDPYQQTINMQSPYMPRQRDGKTGMAIASMILGIISIVSCCIIYLAVPCAVVAIILGALSVKSQSKGMAIAGIITGGIGALFAIGIIILALIGAGFYQEYMDLMLY